MGDESPELVAGLAAGWYDDPATADMVRWWDGEGWTTHLQPRSDATPPPPSLADNAVVRWSIPVGRSGWAIASGYLALLSVLLIFAPLALLTGLIAIWDIRRSESKRGMGRAIFGIAMGLLGSAALLYLLLTG